MFLDILPWGAFSLLISAALIISYLLGVEVGRSKRK
jgi:hypothetical protein